MGDSASGFTTRRRFFGFVVAPTDEVLPLDARLSRFLFSSWESLFFRFSSLMASRRCTSSEMSSVSAETGVTFRTSSSSPGTTTSSRFRFGGRKASVCGCSAVIDGGVSSPIPIFDRDLFFLSFGRLSRGFRESVLTDRSGSRPFEFSIPWSDRHATGTTRMTHFVPVSRVSGKPIYL